MRVLYAEGPASRGAPVSCVAAREGVGEALIGVHAGRVSSREMLRSRVPTLWRKAEGNMGRCVIGERRPSPAWSKTSCTHASHLQGNRDIHWSTARDGPSHAVRIGKVHP